MTAARRTPGRERRAAPQCGPPTRTRTGPRRRHPALEASPGTVSPPDPVIRTPAPASRHVRRSRVVPGRPGRRSGAVRHTGVPRGLGRNPARRLTPARPLAVTGCAAGKSAAGTPVAGKSAAGILVAGRSAAGTASAGAEAPPSPRRRPRHMRTPGAAHHGGPPTRPRAVPGHLMRGAADRCGVRVRSVRRGRAAAARSVATRQRPVHQTRCTHRGSSRRGIRRNCAPRPGAPATAPGWAPIWPNPVIRNSRSATHRPTPLPPRPGPCWTMPPCPANGPAHRPGHPARPGPAAARQAPARMAQGHAACSRARRRPAHPGWPASQAPSRPLGAPARRQHRASARTQPGPVTPVSQARPAPAAVWPPGAAARRP